MERTIYKNQSSKLVADANGGVVALTQYSEGEVIGEVLLYFEELNEINEFVKTVAKAEAEEE